MNSFQRSERPHKCSECSKTLTHKQDLERHTQIHTGGKPYKSLDCDATFSRRSNHKRYRGVVYHLRTHASTGAAK
ncbi:hypothetical protein GQ53DRAFT_637766 [Thozetella sp. PMI_491]|nr:hypothetical protein GQ53DRAFT_637766 [Thozetella sp. PMI_491]